MDDELETLMVDVRASTDGFRSDIEGLRSTIDSSLVDGFARAGNVLERGLLGAIRRGTLGFDDLKRVALDTLNEIAAQALKSGIGNLFGGGPATSGSGGLGGLLTGALGAIFGLPGRATGGPVSPGQAYLVGERGPEMFVPTSAGRVETGQGGSGTGARDVRVAIQIAAPRGSSAPRSLERSGRQVAAQVRNALRQV
ncbi:tail tape measure protein [Paraurantiacibacter namhicola]|uniref:Tail tape measure protein n=1 Tax=Paraurantiacibacter namhicola TaxID=645517 RepID=A0A1C7D560_9SPHN|nr:tail tape measure protein [Paraurantiacibacter namhicola]ANU06600.1 hypothetical protein A6F65_00273 [Paraurantiacibacter namhicola]